MRLYQLIIDGYHCPPNLLRDQNLISKFLNDYPSKIGMNKIMGPYLTVWEGTKLKDWGISGIVVISESHIAIHTFPEWGYISINIVSCKPFSEKETLEYVNIEFKPQKIKIKFFKRKEE